MALEDAITKLTAAVEALIVAMNTVGNPFPAATGGPATEPDAKGKGGRPTKEQAAAKKALEDAAAAGQKIPETGDPVGTTYFFNAPHNSVFSVKLGEKSDLAGVAISPAEFVKKTAELKAALEASTKTPEVDPFAQPTSNAADPFAMAAPATPPKTLEDVVAKLREIQSHPKLGGPAVVKVLQVFGVTTVGNLPGKDMNLVFAEAEKALAAA